MTRARRPTRPATTFGVWDGARLHRPGVAPVDAAAGDLHTVALLAVDHDLEQLWLAGGAHAALGLPAELDTPRPAHPFLAACGWWRHDNGPGLSDWMRFTLPDAGVTVAIAAPGLSRESPWRGLGAAHLLSALERFRELTGVAWSDSGGVTSDRLISHVHDAARGSRLEATVLPPPGAPGPRGTQPDGAELDIGWVRHFPPPAEVGWVHCFDLNCAYLSAAASLALPVGEARRVADGDLSQPGWWLVKVPASPPWLPPPLARRRPTPELQWVTTPTAQLLRELGELVVEDGWAWPEHHRYLEPWARSLRAARMTLVEAQRGPRGDAVLAAVKAVYRQGVGRLGSARRRRGESDPLYQPYWRAAVIAQARVNFWRRLTKTARPIAVDVDAGWWFLPTGDVDGAAQLAGVPLGAGGGQFKPKGASMAGADAARLWVRDRPGVTLTNLRGAFR